MYQLLKQCGIQLCLHTYIMIIKDLCRKIQIRIPKRFSPMLSSSHLARIFTGRCYSAIFQIYKDIRAEMGQELTPDEKISFLSKIPRFFAG